PAAGRGSQVLRKRWHLHGLERFGFLELRLSASIAGKNKIHEAPSSWRRDVLGAEPGHGGSGTAAHSGTRKSNRTKERARGTDKLTRKDQLNPGNDSDVGS